MTSGRGRADSLTFGWPVKNIVFTKYIAEDLRLCKEKLNRNSELATQECFTKV